MSTDRAGRPSDKVSLGEAVIQEKASVGMFEPVRKA
jgi:hypothetical protein